MNYIKKLQQPFFVFISLFILLPANASKSILYWKAYVLEIKAEIDPRMTRYINLGFEAATKDNADLIIIDMNTFGGMVEDADKIRTKILKSEIPVYVWINNNAASAGALISIACDSIYMTDGANIGAASVVNQQGELAPDKFQSYMRSMMRSTAEANGRNPEIAEAMVDPYRAKDSTITKGKVITLTTKEALKQHFCEAQINSMEEFINYHNLKYSEVVYYKLTPVQQLSNWFLNPVISGILIMIILGGIYYELQTPGIGFPIAAAVIAALLYFIPYYMEGLARNWEILLFIAGIILVVIELFAFPGFGVIGIAGIVIIFGSLLLAMIDNVVFDFSGIDGKALTRALGAVLISIIGSLGLVFWGGQRIFNTGAFRKLVLNDSLETIPADFPAENPYALKGKKGTAFTDLHPSGKVEIDGHVYDARTLGQYLMRNDAVEVIESQRGSLVVKKSLKVE
ncbi:MAG: hypothetical protein A3H98_12125 [Bacteroidetes bacterium RIFCSPLOWO2_02_FULL_36_8]|nr:MAG: hypothetical protein A3H98_12125 [Bacteroidetes bacterium RIFCSPLOWO2_02_FULL_36_8]OFY70218.1 MAG: hypothetical protein A3G23_08725 [Bacteroidetes bacterium RIFCSPLOWO2_12_FULL_37_12]